MKGKSKHNTNNLRTLNSLPRTTYECVRYSAKGDLNIQCHILLLLGTWFKNFVLRLLLAQKRELVPKEIETITRARSAGAGFAPGLALSVRKPSCPGTSASCGGSLRRGSTPSSLQKLGKKAGPRTPAPLAFRQLLLPVPVATCSFPDGYYVGWWLLACSLTDPPPRWNLLEVKKDTYFLQSSTPCQVCVLPITAPNTCHGKRAGPRRGRRAEEATRTRGTCASGAGVPRRARSAFGLKDSGARRCVHGETVVYCRLSIQT